MRTLTFILCVAATLGSLRAGPGHDHPDEPVAAGAVATGPVIITEAQAANLGLRSEERRVGKECRL